MRTKINVHNSNQTGPYLNLLGASAFALSLAAGLGAISRLWAAVLC